MHKRSLAALVVLALALPLGAAADPPPHAGPDDDPQTLLDRSVEPVVLTGAQFPGWSAGPDPTAREPQVADDPLHRQSQCYAPGSNPYDPGDDGDHSCYQSSRLPRNPNEGVPVEGLLAYKWNPRAKQGTGQFAQIPFQVDERFTRYLTNNASDFAVYSGADAHNTYAFDREGFRYTSDASRSGEGGSECLARPAPGSTIVNGYATTPDPVRGLDDDDELVFMWRDASVRAPAGATLPTGLEDVFEVPVVDPTDPSSPSYVYVALTGAGGPAPKFTAANGYVRYERDPNADVFVYSQSSFSGYGRAPRGPYCKPDGTRDLSRGAIAQRRPLDTAWITTPRYGFRYEGRWLMTQLKISAHKDGDWTYGPDVIDRWKARAFAQDPGSETPCCGFEEEDTNWGGSSILMGERWGPVRVVRETWGADSGTNVVRREVFYRDSYALGSSLRVHPIPPLDGIYAQWDFNAGRMTRYFNPSNPGGVAVDGSNDEAYGNLDDPCNTRYDGNDTSDLDQGFRQAYRQSGLCRLPYHLSIDVVDVMHSGPSTSTQWEQTSGPHGTVVGRWQFRDVSPGNAQSLWAVPYYRDDSCFDDGTGTDPGPKVNLRSGNEPATYVGTDGLTNPRKCWTPADGDPDPTFAAVPDREGDERYFQGSIGTQGVHLLLIAESDNAGFAGTVPLTEISSEQRFAVLPGDPGNVGERYGRWLEFPLRAQPVPYLGLP